MTIMKINNSTAESIQSLKAILDDNESGAALLITLVSAFNQLVLLYEDSEARHGANLDSTASFLHRLGESMSSMENVISESNEVTVGLHDQVMSGLMAARDDVSKAKVSMGDVLGLYNEFSDNTDEIKESAAGLSKSLLASLNPALGVMLGRQVDMILGIASE